MLGSVAQYISILDGEYEFIEAKISEKSELNNKKIKDSNFPEFIRNWCSVKEKT